MHASGRVSPHGPKALLSARVRGLCIFTDPTTHSPNDYRLLGLSLSVRRALWRCKGLRGRVWYGTPIRLRAKNPQIFEADIRENYPCSMRQLCGETLTPLRNTMQFATTRVVRSRAWSMRGDECVLSWAHESLSCRPARVGGCKPGDYVPDQHTTRARLGE
jgi:hypothetical protein